ncbi:hypothetical protein H4Q26_015710 [Puccinia striiformis f. sp. tritici PST-130]|nr:hypothetical protein H4Q26_015710 [Puccinia striiformis f. sp. tritici PST-130]
MLSFIAIRRKPGRPPVGDITRIYSDRLLAHLTKGSSRTNSRSSIRKQLNKTQVFVEQIKVKQAELASWALDLTTTESKQLQHAEYQEDINDAVAELEKLIIMKKRSRRRGFQRQTQQKADEAKTTLRLSGFFGRLGDLEQIDEIHDVAIFTARAQLDNLVCNTSDTPQQYLPHFKKTNAGRAVIFYLDALKTNVVILSVIKSTNEYLLSQLSGNYIHKEVTSARKGTALALLDNAGHENYLKADERLLFITISIDVLILCATHPKRQYCRNRSPGSPRRTRKERRGRGTISAAAQAFSTAAIPRTPIEYIERAALHTRITNGTIVCLDNTGIVTNRTLAVSQTKGLDNGECNRTTCVIQRVLRADSCCLNNRQRTARVLFNILRWTQALRRSKQK